MTFHSGWLHNITTSFEHFHEILKNVNIWLSTFIDNLIGKYTKNWPSSAIQDFALYEVKNVLKFSLPAGQAVWNSWHMQPTKSSHRN